LRRDSASRIWSVCYRKQDHVPLVALHAFEVLDKDRLMQFGSKEALQFGARATLLVEEGLNQALLFRVEGDDPERAAFACEGRIGETTHDVPHDRARLFAVHTTASTTRKTSTERWCWTIAPSSSPKRSPIF
jgi:hypothetical protein